MTGCLIKDKYSKKVIMNQQFAHTQDYIIGQEIGEYVADLQLHMTLQARNLVPSLKPTRDSREQLLQESQAQLEKFFSRQRLN
jgi:hypothetical protein